MCRGVFSAPRVWFLLAVSLGAGNVLPANGQPATPQPSADVAVGDLKAPPSPAFVLLGVSPSTVERPTGLRAVVVSALSALSVGDGFPRNYAFEVAPYWFVSHGAKTFDDYYRASFSDTMIQQFSLSVATAAMPGDRETEPGTSIAIGARTLLAAGSAHPFLERTRQQLDAAYKRYLNATEETPLIRVLRAAREGARQKLNASQQLSTFQDLAEKLERLDEDLRDIETRLEKADEGEMGELVDERAALLKMRAPLQAEALALVLAEGGTKGDAENVLLLDTTLTSMEATRAKQAASAEAAMQSLVLEIQRFDLQRIGFTAAVAAATSWEVPVNATENARRARSAIWFTPSYRWVTCLQAKAACDAAIDITGVLRYTHDNRLDTSSSVWDAGLRLTWQPRPSLAAGFEWVHRGFPDDFEDSDRAVGVFEYELTNSAFVYASFGRDFREPGVRRNLVSIVGLTLGFGRQPVVRIEPRAGT